jgi:hypothetical protein
MISPRQIKKPALRQECIVAYEFVLSFLGSLGGINCVSSSRRAKLEMETASEGEGSKPAPDRGDENDIAPPPVEAQEPVADNTAEVIADAV